MNFDPNTLDSRSCKNQRSLAEAQSESKFSKQLVACVENLNAKGAQIDLENRLQNLKWCSHEFGLPNFILRSCLFKALQRSRRENVSKREIRSLDGTRFHASGPTLNQADLDVLIGFVRMSKILKFAKTIEFYERTFLKFIDRGGGKGKVGKSDREWLKKTISKLGETVLTFTSGSNEYAGALILEYFRDGLNGRYAVSLNPQFIKLFGLDNWTKLDINIRNSLRGNPLAQFLYGFFHSNARTFPLKVQTLHYISGSEAGANTKTEAARNKALCGWRDDTLRPALEILQAKLIEHGQIFEWSFDASNLVIVKHQPSKSQKRHLSQKFPAQDASMGMTTRR